MFCPEGYFHWGDFLFMAAEWAETAISAENLVKTGGDPKDALDEWGRISNSLTALPDVLGVENTIKNAAEVQFVRDLFHMWIVTNFTQNHLPVVCSPAGVVLRTHWWLSRHADQLDMCPWSWPPQKNLSFMNYFESFRQGGFNGKDIEARFPCFDPTTGIIGIKSNSEDLLNSALDCGEYCGGAAKLLENVVAPFSGWALCWKKDEFPKTLKQVFDWFGIADDSWRIILDDHALSTQRGKTGHGLLHTMDCMIRAFPDGKGGATWQEVENEVGYSRRHIARAIKLNSTLENWAKGGHDQE